MFTFRSMHSQLIVYVDALRKKREDLILFDLNAPAGHIKFTPEGRDENRHAIGVFRTEDDKLAARIRTLIAEGQIPAWEEDEETVQAIGVLDRKRKATAQRIAAAVA